MRKLIILIIFLIIIFLVNLIFYTISDDYKFFLKKIKDNDQVVYTKQEKIDDNLINVDIVKTNKQNEELFDLKQNKVVLNKEIVLWKTYKEVIDLFSLYNLEKLEVNSNLFDLTDEYPDKYFEYYSQDLTLYLFPTKTYTDLFDIFSILDDDLPFSLNEVNNFWSNSFYINLDEDIEDRFVRVVIWYKWIVFWLKIKKTEYNLVKEKLNSLTNK